MDENNIVQCKGYRWLQEYDSVTIEIPILPECKPKIVCKPNHLYVEYGELVIDGELNASVYPDEMMWYTTEQYLIIELAKVNTYKHESIWKKLFKSDTELENVSLLFPLKEADEETQIEYQKSMYKLRAQGKDQQ